VDDDAAAVRLLRAGLEQAGIEVLVAGDGAAALRQLVDHLLHLDLLVTDLNMPNLDGTTLVRIIRAEGGESELSILVIAGTVSDRDGATLARLGVDGIIPKSAGPDAIVRRAAELARGAWARRTGGGSSPRPPGRTAGTSTPVPIGRLVLR
jgi:DNA-binding response OmpR family regulator